jgi:hypothetical protein
MGNPGLQYAGWDDTFMAALIASSSHASALRRA